jgi:hypothetical protein
VTVSAPRTWDRQPQREQQEGRLQVPQQLLQLKLTIAATAAAGSCAGGLRVRILLLLLPEL